MSNALLLKVPESRWSDEAAANMTEAELVLYRSNLLGSDLAITNFGGGNTSAKFLQPDPVTGEETEILMVKGSGGDLGSAKMDSFATLYMDKLLALEGLYKGIHMEDEMVGYLQHCIYNLNPRAPSIDTPLHAYLPFKHVDHMHPDAVIAVACAANCQELNEEIFGGKLGWVPWQRPGFDLGLALRECVEKNPGIKGILLAGHGCFTWGDSAKECYENTLEIIQQAAHFLNSRLSKGEAFGGAKVESKASEERIAFASQIMPEIRSYISKDEYKVGHFSDIPEVLEYVGSNELEKLAAIGTSCPDHFLRTKIRPLIIDTESYLKEGGAYLDRIFSEYRDQYAAYYERCKRDNSPAIRDANPIIYLIPGIGLVSFAKDKATARIASEFYINAINVMRGATAVSDYVGLDEQEAFDIEYWLLEEAKLQRMPKAKPLHGRVAYVTGGAGGIGRATATKLLENGASVLLTDIDENNLNRAVEEFASAFGKDRIRGFVCDVTNEQMMQASFAYLAREFGGIDIMVANAGIASSAPIEEITLEHWRKNYSILVEGYFLAAREAFKLMKNRGGGAIVFVSSKNSLAATPNAAAYASAKAAEVHLARCLALEGAAHQIRVNSVNPDAVLRGSKIWDGDWKKERADAYGIGIDDLEAHYRNRSMLKRSVYPEDIAEAIFFLASDASAKSTGNIINVDAGHAGAFVR